MYTLTNELKQTDYNGNDYNNCKCFERVTGDK